MRSRDHQWIQGTDETVKETLEAELERVKGAATSDDLLQVEEGEDKRSAFLAATKIFHPNRYARRPQQIRALANEVFLRIKAAYEEGNKASSHPAGQDDRLAKAKEEASAVVSKRAKTASAGGGGKVEGEAPARQELRERRREQMKSRLSGSVATPPPRRTAQIRAATAAPSDEEDQSVEEKRFDEAVGMMVSGTFAEAAAAFKALAVGRPSEKRFRMHMHYCQGRVKQAEEQFAEARSEYKRALGMDASFAPAHEALSSLPSDSGRKKSGIISRLFGK